MDDIYKDIEEYNPNKKRKLLIVTNKKLSSIVFELFIRERKLNIFLVLLHNLVLLSQKMLD